MTVGFELELSELVHSMKWLVVLLGAVSLCAASLFLWRLSDVRDERVAWEKLVRQAAKPDSTFEPSTIAMLPAAAQRYFRYTIAPGTPLVSVVEIEMEGQLGMGTKDEPAYRAMTAEQVLYLQKDWSGDCAPGPSADRTSQRRIRRGLGSGC